MVSRPGSGLHPYLPQPRTGLKTRAENEFLSNWSSARPRVYGATHSLSFSTTDLATCRHSDGHSTFKPQSKLGFRSRGRRLMTLQENEMSNHNDNGITRLQFSGSSASHAHNTENQSPPKHHEETSHHSVRNRTPAVASILRR